MFRLNLSDIIDHYAELLKKQDLAIGQNLIRFIKTFGANNEDKQYLISKCQYWQ